MPIEHVPAILAHPTLGRAHIAALDDPSGHLCHTLCGQRLNVIARWDAKLADERWCERCLDAYQVTPKYPTSSHWRFVRRGEST